MRHAVTLALMAGLVLRGPGALAGPGPVPPELVGAAQRVVSDVLGYQPAWNRASFGTGGHCACTVNLSGTDAGVGVHAEVDAETGILVYLLTGRRGPRGSGEPGLTAQEALDRARLFLARIPVRLEEPWRLVRVRWHERRDYTIRWEKVVSGIRLPSYITMTIDGDTGDVCTYALVDDPVVITPQVVIPAEQAVATVAQRWNITRPVVEYVGLMIWYQPNWPGTQTLFWEVAIADPDAVHPHKPERVYGRVNAQTGEMGFSGAPAGVRARAPAKKSPGKGAHLQKGPRIPPHLKVDVKAVASAKLPKTVFELAGAWKWAKLAPGHGAK